MKRAHGVFFYILLLTFLLQSTAGVFAQNVPVLGEVQSTGKVFIGSSAGKWSPAARSYPLLQETGIRTEEGGASIFFKDGSRVDLSKDTTVSISGEAPNYVIHLVKGVIAFSVAPIASLSVSTPSASISVNGNDTQVRKVAYDKASRVLGIVSASEKGTEVRSIAGRIMVASAAIAARTVSTGESLFVGSDGNSKVYRTQGVGGGPSGAPQTGGTSDNDKKNLFWLAGSGGAMVLGVNLLHTDGGRTASPSVP